MELSRYKFRVHMGFGTSERAVQRREQVINFEATHLPHVFIHARAGGQHKEDNNVRRQKT